MKVRATKVHPAPASVDVILQLGLFGTVRYR
jgi:hypothetical protein